ncbi:hypothetical protein BN2476_680128 [Paraburkholderia piptadeniae]|uniref:Uncharacterized protein n=1 Tax=Paraburkholderia piptadeniae TaxID=1701573 RepID=A0A1N7SPV6_9BURK|nr:hypothetical protein BN2476_680128 [Paraburkholderia piptadeniae]
MSQSERSGSQDTCYAKGLTQQRSDK